MVGLMVEPQRADAIVLLGCRIGPEGRPMIPAMRRAKVAASAYHRGVAPVIVASGGRRWGAHPEASSLKRELMLEGVPEAAIIEELCSLSTHENAVFSAAILRRLGARRAAVVTCWWHMPRALANFHAAGIDAVPLPTEVDALGVRRRARVLAHELISGWFDAFSRRRGEALRAGAAHLAGET